MWLFKDYSVVCMNRTMSHTLFSIKYVYHLYTWNAKSHNFHSEHTINSICTTKWHWILKTEMLSSLCVESTTHTHEYPIMAMIHSNRWEHLTTWAGATYGALFPVAFADPWKEGGSKWRGLIIFLFECGKDSFCVCVCAARAFSLITNLGWLHEFSS